jgi:hypothetical protein
MFAGKTTALLRRVQEEASNGRYGTPVRPPPFPVCFSFHGGVGPPATYPTFFLFC